MKPTLAIAALLLTGCTTATEVTDRFGRTSVVHHHDDPCKEVSIGYLMDKSQRVTGKWMQVIPGPCGAILGGVAIGAGTAVGLGGIDATTRVTIPTKGGDR